jgi:hypothetical protein
MFLRTHRVGRSVYTEALESYREGGKTKHRCIARWKADRSFVAVLAEARLAVDDSSLSGAYAR